MTLTLYLDMNMNKYLIQNYSLFQQICGFIGIISNGYHIEVKSLFVSGSPMATHLTNNQENNMDTTTTTTTTFAILPTDKTTTSRQGTSVFVIVGIISGVFIVMIVMISYLVIKRCKRSEITEGEHEPGIPV